MAWLTGAAKQKAPSNVGKDSQARQRVLVPISKAGLDLSPLSTPRMLC